MSHVLLSRPALAAFALILLPVGAVATVTSAKPSDSTQLCDISATTSSGMVKLDALLHADKAVAGSYTFQVRKTGGGGSSTINQGGDFNAAPGQTATLSSVSLGSQGAVYKAKLDVTIGGKSFSCMKQIPGD